MTRVRRGVYPALILLALGLVGCGQAGGATSTQQPVSERASTPAPIDPTAPITVAPVPTTTASAPATETRVLSPTSPPAAETETAPGRSPSTATLESGPTTEPTATEAAVATSGRTEDGYFFRGRADAPVTLWDFSDFL